MTKENICAVHMKTLDHKAVGCSHLTHVDCKNTEFDPQKQNYVKMCPKKMNEY